MKPLLQARTGKAFRFPDIVDDKIFCMLEGNQRGAEWLKRRYNTLHKQKAELKLMWRKI